MTRRICIVCLVLLLTCPATAWANTGSAIVIGVGLHLIYINLFIGLLEGGLLALVFKRKWWVAIPVMILANYFSAWVGFLGMEWIKPDLHPNLYNAWTMCWIMVAAAYILTLLLESPLIALTFWRDPKWLRKTVLASLLVQSISYAGLLWWYGQFASGSLYRQNRIVDASQMTLPAGITVCYIGDDNGEVYAVPLRGGAAQKIGDAHSSRRIDYLSVQPSADQPERLDLVANVWPEGHSLPQPVVVREAFAADGGLDPDAQNRDSRYFSRLEAARLGEARNSVWEFEYGYWPDEGLIGRRTDTGQSLRLAYQTPLTTEWYVRNTTLLPGDIVLFELGWDQICLFDPVRHQVAMIARGHGPVAVVLPQP